MNSNNMENKTEHFQMSPDFPTFAKYVVGTPRIIKKVPTNKGKQIFTGWWPLPPPSALLFVKKLHGSVRINVPVMAIS